MLTEKDIQTMKDAGVKKFRTAFIDGPTHQAQSAAQRRLRRGIGRRLFHGLVEQDGCAEESLEQRIVQFVHDARVRPRIWINSTKNGRTSPDRS